ncbi:hypothetical protein ACFSQD_10665 [Flavihumibacter stibioxidans]|uniref:Tetratricopeptide repeat protein n=1 Tax=Flavihumibacter stibioxidans TaxID=1834163 RepID=A0ABR7MAC1_9BACT|nr:hypothetical protein [Flavihumibacter stibioxidans]MBC6491917.1 hypothetical protein [Flavihumibacter stibioxidans]
MKQVQLLLLYCFLLYSCNNSAGTKEGLLDEPAQRKSISCSPPPTHDKDWYSSGKKAPRLAGLEGIHFRITTNNKEAQEYFNQGLMLAYGFNHAEAARSFYEAMRIDSSCAMAYWGYAFVLGPNYNAGMEEDNFQRAYEAVTRARALAKNATPAEAALIEALGQRYSEQPPADRSPLDIAYANAMKKVFDQYPNNPDIGALYAEAMMDLHPWDLYEKGSKAPKPWTGEILAVLEHLMKLHPSHPGAHHFYIHALEASASPEKALPSAALLLTMVPGSGHLVHMPSHIYINTGDYHQGTLSNLKAVEVDSSYITACHAQGAYPLAYYPHNYHFLAATATLEGNSALAWMAARKLQHNTSAEIMQMPGWGTLQHYYSIPYYIATKLGMYDTILSLPSPPNHLPYPKAIWHYARGTAFAGKNDLANAQKELAALEIISTDSSLEKLSIWNINTVADLVQIARHSLAANLAGRQGRLDTAIALLERAVALEDGLNYNEPPDWFFSVRHQLGATLLQSGQYAAAEKVYRQDLKQWRKNGWALAGLQRSLALQNKHPEAKQVQQEFEQAWQYADIKMGE